MAWQSQEKTREELVGRNTRNFYCSDVKPLSTKLQEMGFARNTFMVLKYDVKVGERVETDGTVKPNPYLSCGPEHRHPSGNGRTNGELNDESIGAAVGGTGSNNGLYSAQTKYGQEIILTKDPAIIRTLEEDLGFKRDVLGVPMSNGGVMVDYEKQREFESMKWACARKADREGQEKRTAAVQRGDIITTYDPNDKDSNGIYRNVRHYEKQSNGDFRAISKYEASNKLGLALQYESNTQQSIATGRKLDAAETNKMLAHNFIDYRGR